ncbi:MAG: glycosyltransferase family 2 protein [Patescibacteria group bacterium]
MEKISVIIVSWNVLDSLKRCLDSVLVTHYSNLEIIVVDNASTDGSDQLATIKNTQNLGFPKAVNIGLKRATGEYLVILNPDTKIPKDFFIKTRDFFTKFSDAWLMGPKLVSKDGSVQGSVFPEGSIINSFKEFWLGQKGLTAKYSPDSSSPALVNNISGSCIVFPRSTFDKTGFLTEEVFMYFEDLEYCRRIRGLGGKIYFNPEISVEHGHGESSSKSIKADPTKTPFWKGYLWDSSLWYYGPVKHYLMTIISWTGQKLHKTFG